MLAVNRNATPGSSRALEVIDISDDEEATPQTRTPFRRRNHGEKPIDLTIDSDEEVDGPAPTTSARKALGKRPALWDEDIQQRSPKAKRVNSAEQLFLDLSDDDEDQFLRPPRGQGHAPRNENGPSIDLTIDSAVEVLEGDIALDENDSAMPALLGEDRLLQVHQERERPKREKLNAKQQRADEALARRLAKEEEKELGKVMKQVQEKSEGIVFKVVIDTETKQLEDGSPAHPDDLARFEPWKDKLKTFGVKVKRFHWIVNYELEKRFEESRDILREICGEEPQELQLFHGTAPGNIDSILNTGFRIGGVGGHAIVNGTGQGYGVYLATDPNLSLGHASSASRIFACRVLPGRLTDSVQYTMTLPKIPVGSGEFETFANRGVYVVRHTQLVLPCYMIEFEYPSLPNFYGAIYGGMGAPAPAPLPPILGAWGGIAAGGLWGGAAPPPPPARVKPVRRQKKVAIATEAKRRSGRLRVKAEV
ncbi:ADP-ribosylation [Hymenopellis radicata]|nr:ADP-ribosylation [Hymenopellis radicata]